MADVGVVIKHSPVMSGYIGSIPVRSSLMEEMW